MKVTQDVSRYTEAVNETARWLESVAEPHNGGLAWPAQPGVSDGYFASLGWGGVGPILFFADLYRTSADPRHLEIAEQGAVWLRSELKSETPKAPGLFTGVAGFSVVFNELHSATGDDRYLSDIKATYDFLASRATTQDGLTNWAEITEILWGTAGIGCVLATIGRDVIGEPSMKLAVGAGDWLLSQALPGPVGIRWNLGEGPLRNMPDYREVYFPNFAHGSAGIAFFLAQLGAASGEQRFIDAALDSTRWILTTCRTDDGTCHAYHHEPTPDEPPPSIGPARDADDHEPLYTLGWCHGPTGLAWLFRELHEVTGDSSWADLTSQAARSVRISGIPEQREPGFWDNLGRCCGSASVAELFLDLHTWRKDPDDLEFARLMVDDMINRATHDADGMRWSNVEFRNDEPVLPAETSYYQGASGNGSTILRLARHLEGDRTVVRWPHAPSWTNGGKDG